MKNSFKTKTELSCSGKNYTIFDISKIKGVEELPYSIKILLENLVRNEDDLTVSKDDISMKEPRPRNNATTARANTLSPCNTDREQITPCTL